MTDIRCSCLSSSNGEALGDRIMRAAVVRVGPGFHKSSQISKPTGMPLIGADWTR